MLAPVDVVLFDLGGVLIDVPGVDAMMTLTGIETPEEVWRRWLTCRWVRSFESGGCSEQEFAEGLIEDWRLAITAAELLEAFQEWVTVPRIGAERLVSDTRTVVPVGCLSNTNAAHWGRHLGNGPLVDLFDHLFLSFQMGMLKPDPETYEHVKGVLGVPAERILFIDDNTMNVEAAVEAGMRAVRATGVDEARSRLVEAGVISAD